MTRFLAFPRLTYLNMQSSSNEQNNITHYVGKRNKFIINSDLLLNIQKHVNISLL